MANQSPLYLGFDLSTQQLKGIAVRSDLKVIHQAKFDFDADSVGFGTTKGVLTNEKEREVFAPVAAFLQALDGVMQRLQKDGLQFCRVKGISGAGMQHGGVFWNCTGEEALQQLDESKSLESQLEQAFSYPFSPNWQDASTQTGKRAPKHLLLLSRTLESLGTRISSTHHRDMYHEPIF